MPPSVRASLAPTPEPSLPPAPPPFFARIARSRPGKGVLGYGELSKHDCSEPPSASRPPDLSSFAAAAGRDPRAGARPVMLWATTPPLSSAGG